METEGAVMNRLKQWIVTKYLPAYARATYEEETARLRLRNDEQEIEIRELRAHIGGLQEGLRALRKITIYTHTP